ncbi:hydroxyacylglutathione hydrolase [Teredinibacter turnerae]|uniref:hydroxyacylglutathione hydrolase n=1 Tax=Teredinibacter turnerae TaxID=2426 RepID=UPI00036211BE|nr:hydroxyacylglutathione hydrolase [Teredinibacter turnerae]
MRVKTFPVATLHDNYVWIIEHQNNALVIDPDEAAPVIAVLKERGLSATAILLTHRHWDHVDGIPELQEHFPCPIYGPESSAMPQVTQTLTEGDHLEFWDGMAKFQIWHTPGHTEEHIAYLLAEEHNNSTAIFCGDTLFSAGCGRLLGGTAEQLYNSLERYKRLAADTILYCTHEYTQANLRFAQAVEPSNTLIREYAGVVQEQRLNGATTLPTTVGKELEINPFLRCDQPEVITQIAAHTGKTVTSGLQTFTALRQWKDIF